MISDLSNLPNKPTKSGSFAGELVQILTIKSNTEFKEFYKLSQPGSYAGSLFIDTIN